MRRLMVTAIVCGLAAAGCTVPPPGEGPNPFACAAGPVDLGPAVRVEAIAADGEVVVVQRYSDEAGIRYDVIDRRAGTRYELKSTGPEDDGARIFMNDAGTLIYGYQYLGSQSEELPWFAHDVASRTTVAIEPAIAPNSLPRAFSADLRHYVEERTAPPGSPPVTWQLVDFITGETSPLGVGTDPEWRTAGFSPDLSLVVQYSAPLSYSKSVRVLDTATGEVVADIGRVENENSSYVSTRFVDDATLLVNDAVPLGAPADGIATDGAFLVDIPTAAVTRIDPGIEKASTSAATPDGTRSVFAVINQNETWARVDDRNRLLADTFSSAANDTITAVVTADGDSAVLHCI